MSFRAGASYARGSKIVTLRVRAMKRLLWLMAATVALTVADTGRGGPVLPFKVETPQDPIDPKNVSTKDSLQLTPEGVGIQIDVDETNRY